VQVVSRTDSLPASSRRTECKDRSGRRIGTDFVAHNRDSDLASQVLMFTLIRFLRILPKKLFVWEKQHLFQYPV
jgi:hypothetical protein